MITVEAEVQKTMDKKILPRKQELIPISLKRKLTYKGSVMEEIVSKSKVKAYFKFFKDNNPLFVDEKLDEKRIDELIQDLTADPQNDDNNQDQGTSSGQCKDQDQGTSSGQCKDCEKEFTHICLLDSPVNMGIENDEDINSDFDSQNYDNDQDFDTVLETFYQKTDQGNGVSDIIAEQIFTQESNPNKRVVVAPTEAGKFINFESLDDIEERCFTHLFPFGVSGYLSSYASKGVSFTNYIKMQLNGIDRRYANDHSYITFLF